jgi:acetyltransferase
MAIELSRLLEPKTLIVVGVSEPEKKEERYSRYFRFLVQNLSRFKGKLQVVDISGKLPGSEKDLKKISKENDLAVVALPKKQMTKNFQKIISRTKGLLLVSDEVEPKQLDKLLSLFKRKKLLLLGPATFGVLNPEIGLAAVVSVGLGEGSIGIISQKRSVTGEIVSRIHELRKNVSKVICTGEGLGVGETELIDYLSKDKKTAVICVYVESLRNGRDFIETVKSVSAEKPILILKGGRMRRIFECAVAQAKGILAENIEKMIAGADILSKQPPLPGKRVVIVTNLAGQGGFALKFLNDNGLTPARPSEEVSKRILKKYPKTKIGEFVDVGVFASADVYRFVLDQLIPNGEVDGAMVICDLRLGQLETEELVKLMERKPKDKPTVGVVLVSGAREKILDVLAKTRTPIYESVELAVAALRISNSRYEIEVSRKSQSGKNSP